MGCCLLIGALMAPRIAMILILLLTDWFTVAYETMIWPVLGFLFMPYTTLAYMAVQLHGATLSGWWLALFILAIVFDVGGHGSGAARRKRRAR